MIPNKVMTKSLALLMLIRHMGEIATIMEGIPIICLLPCCMVDHPCNDEELLSFFVVSCM